MLAVKRAPHYLSISFIFGLSVINPCLGQNATKKQGIAPANRPAPKAIAPPADAPAVVDPAAKARMKQLLKVWESESAKLTTLDVGIDRVDKSPQWPDEVYVGRAIFKDPNLARLEFKKKEMDDKGEPQIVPYEQIICSGKEIWQYRYDTKEVFIFPLDKQNQKRALEEGPLPFLFNMKAAEAEARYDMDLVKETAEYYVISVLPKVQVDQETFMKAFLQLNRKTYLPDRIFLVSPDSKSTKLFTLKQIQRNAAVGEKSFIGVEPKKPWSIRRDVLNKGQAANPPRGTAPNGAAAPSRPANATAAPATRRK